MQQRAVATGCSSITPLPIYKRRFGAATKKHHIIIITIIINYWCRARRCLVFSSVKVLKLVVTALRQLEGARIKFLEDSKSIEVFNDDETSPFLQLYRDALQKITDDFYADVKKTPASVVGIGEDEDEDDGEDGDSWAPLFSSSNFI
jgi:hypothetical protein